MVERKPDRRPERTRKQLHHALLALVVERDYESITIQDILDRANIGRSTFYVHFRDKDELLLSGMSPLRTSLMQEVKNRAATDPTHTRLSFLPAFFEHADFYRRAYASLSGPMRLEAEHQISDLLRDLIREDIRLHGGARRGAVPMDAVCDCIVGALMGIIGWWIAQKRAISPSEVTRLSLVLLRPTVEIVETATGVTRDRGA